MITLLALLSIVTYYAIVSIVVSTSSIIFIFLLSFIITVFEDVPSDYSKRLVEIETVYYINVVYVSCFYK